MKVIVNWELCESNALCVEACPEMFSINEKDFLVIATDSPDESLRGKLQDAAAACPRQAMTIEG